MAFGMFQGRQVLFLILCIAFFAVLLYLYARIPKNKYYLPLLITGAALPPARWEILLTVCFTDMSLTLFMFP